VSRVDEWRVARIRHSVTVDGQRPRKCDPTRHSPTRHLGRRNSRVFGGLPKFSLQIFVEKPVEGLYIHSNS
jgi:hypothetical protein